VLKDPLAIRSRCMAVEREEGHGFGLHFKAVAVGGVMVHGGKSMVSPWRVGY